MQDVIADLLDLAQARPRACLGGTRTVLALVFSLAFSALPALAATCTSARIPSPRQRVPPRTRRTTTPKSSRTTFSNGSTIVAAFQVGRIFDGGACAIGFATSTNNGASWTNGLLPGITKWTSSQGVANGPYDRATDAAVAYDAKHNVWLISSLGLTEAGGVHGTACSPAAPPTVASPGARPSPPATGTQLDKNWIVCDDTATSPFYGNCYTEWDDNGNGNLLQMSTSSDGGQTWGAAEDQ